MLGNVEECARRRCESNAIRSRHRVGLVEIEGSMHNDAVENGLGPPRRRRVHTFDPTPSEFPEPASGLAADDQRCIRKARSGALRFKGEGRRREAKYAFVHGEQYPISLQIQSLPTCHTESIQRRSIEMP